MIPEDEICYGVAYYKGREVNVPFLNLPDDAIDNEGNLKFFLITYIDNPQVIDPLPLRKSKALKNFPALAKETIDPNALSDKDLKNLCKMNHIPLSWVTDRIKYKKIRDRKDLNRRENRKYESLALGEFRSILKELQKLNEQVALIVKILWFFNQELGKGGGFITLEQILRLPVWDVFQDFESGPKMIRLMRSGMNGTQLVVHYLPPRLGNSLFREVKGKVNFVFCNKKGGPLHPVQVDKWIKRAAQNIGIKKLVTCLLYTSPSPRD